MGVLEEVMKQKNQGKTDEQIVNDLQEQGVSPKEITDAISQAQIKTAVTDEETQGAEPSVMAPAPIQTPPPEEYAPQQLPQELPAEEYAPQQPGAQQEFYPQQGYGEYSQQGLDTDTIIEVAKQVFSEEIKKIQKKVDENNEFKTLSQIKLKNIEDRLKKIELIITKLQTSILDKVGSYGKNLETIKRELSMVENSFRKVVKPIRDKVKKNTKKAKKTSRKRNN